MHVWIIGQMCVRRLFVINLCVSMYVSSCGYLYTFVHVWMCACRPYACRTYARMHVMHVCVRMYACMHLRVCECMRKMEALHGSNCTINTHVHEQYITAAASVLRQLVK